MGPPDGAGRTALVVGAGLGAGVPAEVLLPPDDVADAVRWIVGTLAHVCPVEVELQPQGTPRPGTAGGTG